MPAQTEHHSLILRAIKLATCGVWLIAALYVLIVSAPNNPLLPAQRHHNRLLLLMPEGWAFFTLDPHEPDVYLYRELAAGAIVGVETQGYRELPLAAVDRSGRLQSGALRTLAKMYGADVWADCRGELAACARSLPEAPVRLTDPPRAVPTCGRVILEKRPPTPWTWFRNNPGLRMPSKIIRLEIPC